MNILATSTFYYDSAAYLVWGGEIVAGASRARMQACLVAPSRKSD